MVPSKDVLNSVESRLSDWKTGEGMAEHSFWARMRLSDATGVHCVGELVIPVCPVR